MEVFQENNKKHNHGTGKVIGIVLRCILMLLGITGIVCFIMPLLSYGIMNIWNISGLAVSIVLLLVSIFFSFVLKQLKALCKSLAGRIICCAAAVLLCTAIILAAVISGFMIKYALNSPENDVTLVVLGCRVIGEEPSLMLEERLSAAYEYLSENEGCCAVLSGGQGSGEDISEAECMYRYLTGRGISADRLYIEDKSVSTRENLMFSGKIIEAENLNSDIAVVTNEFHVYRASMAADDLGMNSYAVPAKTTWKLFPTYYFRELFGVMYEWVF